MDNRILMWKSVILLVMMGRDKCNARHKVTLIDQIHRKAQMMVDGLLRLLFCLIVQVFLTAKLLVKLL